MGYREGAEAERARSVRFASLSEATQTRLLATCHGDGEALLSHWVGVPGGAWLGAAIGASGVALAAFALLSGFGELGSSPRPRLVQGGWSGVGFALAMLGAAWQLQRRPQAVPAGVFVLPLDLIDTRSDPIRIFPMSMLQQLRAHEGRLVLRFEGDVTYELPAHGSAGELVRALQECQQRAAVAQAAGDGEALRRLDPFHDERGGWPPDAAFEAPWALPRGWWVGVAVMVAAALGGGQLAARAVQHASDERGLAKAERERDDEALRGYIERGGLLAERADAIRLGIARSIEGDGGLLRYLSSGGRRRDEADDELIARLRTSPSEAALERYLKVGHHTDEADALLFHLASEPPSESALRRYVQRGGKLSDVVETSLLPRVFLGQAVQEQNALVLRALATPGPSALLQQLQIGPPAPEVRDGAVKALQRMFDDQRAALQAKTNLASPFTQALDGLLRDRRDELSPLQLATSLHLDPEPIPSSSYRVDHRSAGLRAVLHRALSELINPRLIGLDKPATSDGSPVQVGEVELIYDIVAEPPTYATSVRGKLILTTSAGRTVVSVKSRCSAPYTAYDVLLERALREAIQGRELPCERRWHRRGVPQ